MYPTATGSAAGAPDAGLLPGWFRYGVEWQNSPHSWNRLIRCWTSKLTRMVWRRRMANRPRRPVEIVRAEGVDE